MVCEARREHKATPWPSEGPGVQLPGLHRNRHTADERGTCDQPAHRSGEQQQQRYLGRKPGQIRDNPEPQQLHRNEEAGKGRQWTPRPSPPPASGAGQTQSSHRGPHQPGRWRDQRHTCGPAVAPGRDVVGRREQPNSNADRQSSQGQDRQRTPVGRSGGHDDIPDRPAFDDSSQREHLPAFLLVTPGTGRTRHEYEARK